MTTPLGDSITNTKAKNNLNSDNYRISHLCSLRVDGLVVPPCFFSTVKCAVNTQCHLVQQLVGNPYKNRIQ